MSDTGDIVPLEEFRNFILRCSEKVGISAEHATDLADLVVSADYRGHYSHGLKNLGRYLTCAQNGIIAVKGEPEILKETISTALVDGNNLLGPVVGKFCMDLAVQKARQAGIGWVCARGCNHFGIAAWYGIRAMEQGMIGLCFTNSSPGLAPTRSKTITLGTNPICVASPGNNGDGFVLDMATSAVAYGKVIHAKRIGASIPEGWAIDTDGKVTTDPNQLYGMLPLGGAENTSGYKGYGLAMMVEIFCGILSGSNYGHHIISVQEQTSKVANLGQCFVAINPEAFEDGFTDRMSDLIDFSRNLEPVEREKPVLVAGDPEKINMAKCDRQGGILYHPEQIKYANELASTFGVEPMKTIHQV